MQSHSTSLLDNSSSSSVSSTSDITRQFALGVHIRDDRPRTEMGPQGDHVTAYSLIKAMIYSVITDLQPDIVVKRLFGIATTVQNITEEKVGVLSQQLSNIRKKFVIFSDEELLRLDTIFENIGNIDKTSHGKKEVKEDEKREKDQALLEKIKDAIQIQEIHCLEEMADKIIDFYLELRNKVSYASFPEEGNVSPPAGEGARVKKAVTALRALDEKAMNEELEDKELEGAAEYMFQLFWYPKIPQKDLIDMSKEEEQKKWESICKKKKYNKGTMPRDNKLETLYQVTANHIELVFSCFPALVAEYRYVEIKDKFLNLVASTGKIANQVAHWGMVEKEYKDLAKGVNGFLPPYITDLEKGRSDSESEEASSRHSSQMSDVEESSEEGSTAGLLGHA